MDNKHRRRIDFDFQPQPRPIGNDLELSRKQTIPHSGAPPVHQRTPDRTLRSVKQKEVAHSAQPTPLPLPTHETDIKLTHSKNRRRRIAGACVVAVCVLAAILIGGYVWYQQALSPYSRETQKQTVVIAQGTSPDAIGKQLHEKGLIRSELAFKLYSYESNTRDKLQAGTYFLAPVESTQDIVKALSSGAVSESSITFYPGAVLDAGQKGSESTSVVQQLKKAGFSDRDIQEALRAVYQESVLFTGKPSATNLEGYIYGDTYRYTDGASAKVVVKKALDEFNQVVQDKNLIAGFQAQGLSLYQGIVLSSIVQREITANQGCKPTDDQRIVAQIFLSRLKAGEVLGSDVTYMYGAAISGQQASPSLNSPYNTRTVKGLPPGPIAVPGCGALVAVTQPADTNYTYFLSGDDDKTYYANTEAEHQANIAAHCHRKCSEN